MSGDRIAWVGATEGFEPILAVLRGEICTRGPVPDGWVSKASPAEAVSGADFAFVAATSGASWQALLARGVTLALPAGACVVLCGAGGNSAEIRDALDDAGFDCLDMALLTEPVHFAFGGDRDTFNLLKLQAQAVGRAFYCGGIGAGGFAAAAERQLALLAPEARIAALPEMFAAAEAGGAFPQAIRNVLKAGPLSSPDFDAASDALTVRT